jgi:hypothetical protein
MGMKAAMRLAAMAGLLWTGSCLAADPADRAFAAQAPVTSMLSPSAASTGAAALQAPLPGASTADHAMQPPPEPVRQWSVLAAIALIVAAVAWSLLRQPAAGGHRRR